MEEQNRQIQHILRRLERIETDLEVIRDLVLQLGEHSNETDQDLVIVDAEPVIHAANVQPAAIAPEPRAIQAPQVPRAPTRQQIRQEGRWRAQNWAIREREARAAREELQRLARSRPSGQGGPN
jgi:hypothetical protein